MSTDRMTRAWMEIRAKALTANLARIRASVGPDVGLIPMVKADAYGLGVGDAVTVLGRSGPWGFGVATVEEGMALRSGGLAGPVLVSSPVPPSSVEDAVSADLILSVSDDSSLALLEAAALSCAGRPSFHLEIDTGMGRAGVDWRRVNEWGPRAHRAHDKGVRWAGCFTHLHSADEGPETVVAQWKRFREALAAAGPPDGVLIHALNSAGALRCPEYAADAVRPGIFLYGGRAARDLPEPEPVASVRARVVHVREAPAGTTVGYGATYRATKDERWATVAIGYGDGLPRALGNRGSALVRGRRVPIIGRISMDVTVVDISEVASVGSGDVVIFLGTDGEERITVDEMAELVGTISYEILTGFTPRLPRIWMDDEDGF
jgi:alanine racemase